MDRPYQQRLLGNECEHPCAPVDPHHPRLLNSTANESDNKKRHYVYCVKDMTALYAQGGKVESHGCPVNKQPVSTEQVIEKRDVLLWSDTKIVSYLQSLLGSSRNLPQKRCVTAKILTTIVILTFRTCCDASRYFRGNFGTSVHC